MDEQKNIEEIEQTTLEQTENLQENQQEQIEAQNPEESPQAKNFKALREAKEKLEKERDEAYAKLAAYEKMLQEQQAKKVAENYNEDIDIGEEDVVEGKHLKKVSQEIKKIEQELQQYKQQAQVTLVETKLKMQYPDFDAVVTKENIDKLKENFPEIAKTINDTKDIYSKAVTAYEFIKRMNTSNQEKELISKNNAKPKPATGSSPLSYANAFANGLTEDLKRKLYKEMIEAAQNR